MNTQRTGIKAITFVTLALFLSGADARGTRGTGLSGSFRATGSTGAVGSAGHIAGSTGSHKMVSGKQILNNDPLLIEEDEYIDFIQFAQKAMRGLDQDEIQDLIKECPELEVLNRPGPFDREMVTGIIDASTGTEIDEKEIMELMRQNKMMQEQFSGLTSGRGSASRRRSAKGTGHHRNLNASMFGDDVERRGERLQDRLDQGPHPVVGVLKKIDPIIWRISMAYEQMNDYSVADQSIKDALEATQSEFVDTTLNSAEDLHAKGVTSLYSSYRWLKTSARVLHRLLKRVEFKVRSRDRKESQIDKYYDDLYSLNEMKAELTPEEEEAQEAEIMKLEEEVFELWDEIYETELVAQEALDTFGSGIETSEKYLKEAEDYSTQSRNKVSLVRNHLIEKRDIAKANVDGKTDEYKTFAKEQRAIAYGTCAAVCISPLGIFTGGTACAACYVTAAAILETKLSEFRDKNEALRKKYQNMASNVDVILDRCMDIIMGLNDLDYDIEKVGELIEDAWQKYEDIKGTDIAFLTEEAGQEDGTFTEFMEMLERTMEYEKNIRSCGKPDCVATCMQEPIFNEGNDYKGCWDQTMRGNKCMNWLEAGQEFNANLGIGDHNYCRDPTDKGQAWCYLDDPSDGKTWEYCVDPDVNPLV